MDFFTHKHGALHAEDVSITELANAVGTPFYCYSTATITRHVTVFREALSAINPRICFAVKANSNLAVLATMARLGVGADVVSEGEARRAVAAGISPDNIVFSGVGKTADEMRYALSIGIFQFNVESDRELLALNDVAISMGKKAAIALRVNPDVDAKTHAKISTGKSENKFGIAIDDAIKIYKQAASLPGIQVQGISMHIGSQLTQLEPFRAAYLRVRALVEELRNMGISIRTVDLGGGLGVPYAEDDAPPLPLEYGAMVAEIFNGFDAEFIVEPGRLIVGNAGVLVSRVLYIKRASRNYLILDAGMNDLMRPALYDALHDLVPVNQTPTATETFDVVGPVCETSDIFARDVNFPALNEGDLVAFRTAGAYGASMANSYNSRLLIPEVLVRGDQFAVIRPRPTYEQMLGADSIPDWV
jgi:diaminopimelate decarboxylase